MSSPRQRRCPRCIARLLLEFSLQTAMPSMAPVSTSETLLDDAGDGLALLDLRLPPMPVRSMGVNGVGTGIVDGSDGECGLCGSDGERCAWCRGGGVYCTGRC